MKANAPEKIYIQPSTIEELSHQNIVYTKPLADNSIEYTRTDAFIEKVERFLENKLYDRVEIQVWGTVIPSLTSKKEFIDEFRKYMEESKV